MERRRVEVKCEHFLAVNISCSWMGLKYSLLSSKIASLLSSCLFSSSSITIKFLSLRQHYCFIWRYIYNWALDEIRNKTAHLLHDKNNMCLKTVKIQNRKAYHIMRLHIRSAEAAVVRESREGWPLLNFETEVNGDSKSKNETGHSLVGSLGLSCQFKRFLFSLGCSSWPSTNIFFVAVHYSISIPLSPSSSNLGREPCWVACLLVCVPGRSLELLFMSISNFWTPKRNTIFYRRCIWGPCLFLYTFCYIASASEQT